MRNTIIRGISFVIFLLVQAVSGQQLKIFKSVSSEEIRVEASSEFPGFEAEETINGSGMAGHLHKSQNLGKTMWISKISDRPVRARKQTKLGVVWLLYEFDSIQKLDLIEIWNHNQDNHTNRGLQKVYLQYSLDGKNWKVLKNSGKNYFILPEAGGRKEEPPNFHLELNDLTLKYFCITADLEEGNYYHDHSKGTLEEAKWENQNINYYGLSEVRFYEETEKDINKIEKINEVTFQPTQGYRKTAEGPSREFTIKFDNPLFTGGKIEVSVNNKKIVDQIPPSKKGIYEFTSLFPPGLMEEAVTISFSFESLQGVVNKELKIDGARKWVVYFLPHSHLDIGYTHRHEDVMDLQLRNIDMAVRLSQLTKEYPEGSKFKWNVETMWPVKEYLARYGNSPKGKAFINAVENGSIALNASLGNILTGISKQEELTHYFDDAHRIAKKLDIEINSVMMSDVPGFSWGIVTAMAENGMKYFSAAPNFVPHLLTGGSRVGLSHIEWGDYPFYWLSQSGEEKILFWSAGQGYSFFHDWLGGRLSSGGLDPIWDYLKNLELEEFPYNISYFRYTINGDNGPPDPEMSDIIRKWNKKYQYPQFIIGTTEELFTRFENQYKEEIPSFKGDFTPYWEDGAASTAAELAKNRYNSERLNQLEILWSMVDPSTFPFEDFKNAWRNIVLFSEHTWGASASGSAPESKFTKMLWKEKKRFAIKADSLTNLIFEKSISKIKDIKNEASFIQVFNTNVWPRTDIVKIATNQDLKSAFLTDEKGNKLPLQDLGNNKWIFIAEDIPGLSSKVFKINYKNQEVFSKDSSLIIKKDFISNGLLSVSINSKDGTISSLIDIEKGFDYAAEGGLNKYIYTGRNASTPQYVEQVQDIIKLHEGPVAVSLRIVSAVPGANFLKSDITLYKGLKRVDITNTIDKTKNYDKENIRFSFPFNIPNSETIIDLAFGEMIPERNQLSGANKNFFSANNGVTVSGLKNSILLTTIGTPILELGEMTGEAWMKDMEEFLAWDRATTSSSTIFSWVMNNSWGTNYKASQEGIASFNYSIIPIEPNSHLSKKKSRNIAHPLIGILSNKNDSFEQLFSLSGKNKISVSTMRPTKDGKGFLLRLVNLSNRSVKSSFEWKRMEPEALFLSNNKEEILKELEEVEFWMKPYGTKTFKIKI